MILSYRQVGPKGKHNFFHKASLISGSCVSKSEGLTASWKSDPESPVATARAQEVDDVASEDDNALAVVLVSEDTALKPKSVLKKKRG